MKDWNPQHNVKHIRERVGTRAPEDARQAIALVLEYCKTRCKRRQVPNGPWRIKVFFKGNHIGHIVGTGVIISTYLSLDQNAKGVELR